MKPKNKSLLDHSIDRIVFEHERRIKWFLAGQGIHGLSPKLFSGLSTERLVELYNVEMVYFKPWTKDFSIKYRW